MRNTLDDTTGAMATSKVSSSADKAPLPLKKRMSRAVSMAPILGSLLMGGSKLSTPQKRQREDDTADTEEGTKRFRSDNKPLRTGAETRKTSRERVKQFIGVLQQKPANTTLPTFIQIVPRGTYDVLCNLTELKKLQ